MVDRARLREFMVRQHLPLGLLLVLLVGFFLPTPGAWLSRNTPLSTLSLVLIFFISGLNLATQDIHSALKARSAIVFGLISILALSPLLCYALAALPLTPREFPLGLALFICMPATVSSGVLMTAEAKGNAALALLFSVVSNVLGVFTAPFFIASFLKPPAEGSGSSSGSADIPTVNPWELLWKLTLAILLPLAVGKAARWKWPAVIVPFVTAHKAALRYTSSALLISVPWMTISTSSARLRTMTAGGFFAVCGVSIAMHAALLAANYAVTGRRGLKLPDPERKATVISASQKTVNTAVSIINLLPDGLADRGLLTLPCIIAHLLQVLMDSVLASQWGARTTAAAAAASAKGDEEGKQKAAGTGLEAGDVELAAVREGSGDDAALLSEGAPAPQLDALVPPQEAKVEPV